mmetsp:Transcript_7836/g.10245  ORF Transcript_7836/g.10245 Transcript_7836/m.10245 type:complete len:161 (+) Transcript_7836:72-554(+)
MELDHSFELESLSEVDEVELLLPPVNSENNNHPVTVAAASSSPIQRLQRRTETPLLFYDVETMFGSTPGSNQSVERIQDIILEPPPDNGLYSPVRLPDRSRETIIASQRSAIVEETARIVPLAEEVEESHDGEIPRATLESEFPFADICNKHKRKSCKIS